MESKYMMVTPELAKRWLETNTKNRPVRNRRVLTYAADMAAGRWKKTPQGIIFDTRGVLLDGQHRLHAVLESGCLIEMYVTKGAPPDIRDALDQGVARNASDIISWMHPSWNWVTQRPAIAIAIADGPKPFNDGYDRSTGVSMAHRIELVHRYRNAMDWVISQMPTKIRGVTVAGVMAVICRAWMQKGADHERLSEFCQIMNTGMPLNHRDDASAILLRNWLLSGRKSPGGGSQKIEIYRRTQRALMAFLNRERITRLYECMEDLFPIPVKK